MDTETEFDELAGILPGLTTIREILERLGNADEVLPSTDLSDNGDAGVFLQFNAERIAVVYTGDTGTTDSVIEEVRLLYGNPQVLRCGLHVGMPCQDAAELIRQIFAVRDEYDDAISFAPSKRPELVACAEFMGENAITSLELYIDVAPRQNNRLNERGGPRPT